MLPGVRLNRPRRIVADQYLACWSPDGATIAVATYLGGKIWFLNKHGRHEQNRLSSGCSLVDLGHRLVTSQRPVDVYHER